MIDSGPTSQMDPDTTLNSNFLATFLCTFATMRVINAFLFIVMATVDISFCNGSSYVRCIEIERQALLRFKKDLIDPLNRLASWTTTDGDCCTWSGVVCDNLTSHILELNLRSPPLKEDASDAEYEAYERSNLAGKISPALLDIKHLISLDLSNNNFEGIHIPEFIGSLKNLRYLNLSFNQFEGMIPYQFANLTNLQYLGIGNDWGSMLYVENFWWLSSLSLLEQLDLSGVDLSKSSDWLHVINSLPSLGELKLSACGLHHFPQIPTVNLSSLATIDLSSNRFIGPIPERLQNLTSLRHLDLSENYFNSSIPDWLYRLSHLEKLDLSFNNFEGRIPITMGRLCNLRSISMELVELNQELSEVLDILSGCVAEVLEYLDLSYCQLLGHFTHSIGKFKNLQFLQLAYNSVSGPIPLSIGELSSLQVLFLSHNKLNGTLSEIHFANLTKLISFEASGNSLILNVSSQWIPPFKLQLLGLSSCFLGPQFPSWLRSQKNLQYYLDISKTGIVDSIPAFLFKLPLEFVNLSHNQLYGEIPNLSDSNQLELLDLNSNNLSGRLPLIPFNLYVLDLSNNSLSGSILNFFCHEKNESKASMQILILNQNLLHGELPDCLMKWQNLEVLNLGNNRFTGGIPISFGSLKSLHSLNLRKNNFSGTIPMSLQNCTKIVALDLGGNQFVGNIPMWIGERFSRMKILNLRSNKFHGPLSKKLCLLSFLQILDLANNSFLGMIPKCIGNFSAMRTKMSSEEWDLDYGSDADFYSTYSESASLVSKGQIVEYNTILKLVRTIDLSGNNFSGEIPKELTNLVTLQSLNLSHNILTGRIPENVGIMSSLESIDFSANQLFGEIPQSISNLTFLSYLDLSNNHLTGKIPLGTQLQGFDASRFAGNELCGSPLPNDCNMTVPTSNDENRGKKDGNEHEEDYFYMTIALGFVVGFWSVIGPLLVNKRWRTMYYLFLESLANKLRSVVMKCC